MRMPPSLTRLDPSIPLALDMAVLKALSKRPEDRYNSAREMVEAVRNAIIAPLSFSLNANSSPVAPFPAPSQPYNSSNSLFGAVPNAYYPFETSNRSEPPSTNSNAPYGSIPNISYTSAPGDVVYTPHGSMPYSPLTNTFNATQNPQAPVYTNHVQNQPHKSRVGSNWILAFCVVIVLCIVGVLLVPHIAGYFTSLSDFSPISTPLVVATATPIPTATATPSEEAEAVVQRYYRDINKTDFLDAYHQWSAAYQLKYPYDQFAGGFAGTQHDNVTYEDTIQRTDGTYQVNVRIATTEVDDSGVTIIKNFQGYYIVGLDAGELKLLPTSNLNALSK